MNGRARWQVAAAGVIAALGVVVPIVLATRASKCFENGETDNGEVARILASPMLLAWILWFSFVLLVPPRPLERSGWRYVFGAAIGFTGVLVVVALGLLFLNTADCSG